ncbi:Xylose isomerase-like TIM barrel [compost metagenome]
MNNFLIGQYGGFDYSKYNRDFKEGFYGIEACLFESEEDMKHLKNESALKGFHVGVHFPFRAGNSNLRDALFLSQDDRVRKEAFELIQRELDYLSSLRPSYVLFHYPKPVILDDRVNWSTWKFADRSDYEYESNYSFAELQEKSELLFEWLTEKSLAYDFTPILEFDALNRYIYETNYLEGLLDKYNRIKLCLDTGRMFLQEKIDPHFNTKYVLNKYARYAESVHLSNVQVTDHVQHRHYPALPHLNPAEGWAPIEEYLKIIIAENPNVKIMFEHRSDWISDDELEQCYSWVHQFFHQ